MRNYYFIKRSLHNVAVVLLARSHAVVGESLTVTCVIPNHLAGVYDSSQLVFDYGADVMRDVNDTFVDLVNSTAAVLHYPSLTLDWDGANVGCYVKYDEHICGSQPISVSRKCSTVCCCRAIILSGVTQVSCPFRCHTGVMSSQVSCRRRVLSAVMQVSCLLRCHAGVMFSQLSYGCRVLSAVMQVSCPLRCHAGVMSSQLSYRCRVLSAVMQVPCPLRCHAGVMSSQVSCPLSCHASVMFSQLSCSCHGWSQC